MLMGGRVARLPAGRRRGGVRGSSCGPRSRPTTGWRCASTRRSSRPTASPTVRRHPGFGRLGPDLASPTPISTRRRAAAARTPIPRLGSRDVLARPARDAAASATCIAARCCGRPSSARGRTSAISRTTTPSMLVNIDRQDVARRPQSHLAPTPTSLDGPGRVRPQRAGRAAAATRRSSHAPSGATAGCCTGAPAARCASTGDLTEPRRRRRAAMDPHPAAARYPRAISPGATRDAS